MGEKDSSQGSRLVGRGKGLAGGPLIAEISSAAPSGLRPKDGKNIVQIGRTPDAITYRMGRVLPRSAPTSSESSETDQLLMAYYKYWDNFFIKGIRRESIEKFLARVGCKDEKEYDADQPSENNTNPMVKEHIDTIVGSMLNLEKQIERMTKTGQNEYDILEAILLKIDMEMVLEKYKKRNGLGPTFKAARFILNKTINE